MIDIDNQIYLANRRVKMLVVSVENLLMKKGEEEANLAALEEQLLSEKLNRREVYARMSKLRYDLQSIGANSAKKKRDSWRLINISENSMMRCLLNDKGII